MTLKIGSQTAPLANLLHAKALTVRIELLEDAFTACNPANEMRLHLILIELGTAYKTLMQYHDSTKRLILAKAS